MKRSICHATTVAAAALVLTAWASQARAADTGREPVGSPSYTAPPVVVAPPRDVITTEERVPNAGLIASGVMMFGIPYISSVIVAASSDRSGDKNLYIPIAGPWVDLADRGKCHGLRCENETTSQVLLVLDGILQGVGALQVAGGFIFPTTRTVVRTAGVHVTPTAGLSSVGLSAYGAF